MWKGAAETLKAIPQIRNTRPKISPVLAWFWTAAAMSVKRVEPAKP